jgi:glycosyltransferase involved in cell wall biosynthesis
MMNQFQPLTPARQEATVNYPVEHRGLGRISIVIPNYNYAEYVGEAISSALALDWDDVEVIVVDDGSTDDSMAVIAPFEDRITVVEQANAGPRVACNTGFALSTGEVVIFLDSDDTVSPALAREIANVWRPGVSKVQVQMQRIDRRGDPIGAPFPHFGSSPTPEKMRQWMRATSAYPTPPGSGNAYSRVFLDEIFPLDDRCGNSTDSACLAAAPILGDVVTIAKPLVSYRVHGNNRSNLLTDPETRFPLQITRAYQRQLFAAELGGIVNRASIAPLFRGRHLLQMRIAEFRVNGGIPAPIPGDGRRRMMRNIAGALFAPGPEPFPLRVAVSAWCWVTLIAPRAIALRLITRRFGR